MKDAHTECDTDEERNSDDDAEYTESTFTAVRDQENVYVNARDNLCDDLAMLALTYLQVQSEFWELIYLIQKVGLRFKVTVRYLNFFPVFSFC